MFKPLEADVWQVGVAPAPAPDLIAPDALRQVRDRVVWAPEPGPWRYRADPFGLVRDGEIHVFVEAYDYRTKHGVIEHMALSPTGGWSAPRIVLSSKTHLSYPFVLEHGGAAFMVPESHQAHEAALYKADDFPGGWRREAVLLDNLPVAEPSLIEVEGRWWMFFTLVGPGARDQKELHAAYADRLTGPWILHPQNPVRVDQAGARPGGTPWIGADGCVVLPVQDCSRTYGGAIRFLRIATLDPRSIVLEPIGATLTGDLISASHPHGLHTFAACGGSTLIDVKWRGPAPGKRLLDMRRRLHRLAGGIRPGA